MILQSKVALEDDMKGNNASDDEEKPSTEAEGGEVLDNQPDQDKPLNENMEASDKEEPHLPTNEKEDEQDAADISENPIKANHRWEHTKPNAFWQSLLLFSTHLNTSRRSTASLKPSLYPLKTF